MLKIAPAGLALVIVGLSASPALAYVDLGVVTVVVQTLIAVGVGVVITVKLYWQRINDAIRGDKNGKSASNSASADNE